MPTTCPAAVKLFITDNEIPDKAPDLTVQEDGTVHIVFSSNEGSKSEIVYVNSLNWENLVNFTDNSVSDDQPSISSNTNIVVACWRREQAIVVRMLANSSGEWDDERVLIRPGNISPPQIKLGESNVTHICWLERTETTWGIMYSTFQNNSFTSPVDVFTVSGEVNPPISLEPSITVDHLDRPHIVFSAINETYWHLYHIYKDIANWILEEIPNCVTSLDSTPSAEYVTQSQTLHVCFVVQIYSLGQDDLFYIKKVLNTWDSSPTQLTTSSRAPRLPTISVQPNYVSIIFYQTSGAGFTYTSQVNMAYFNKSLGSWMLITGVTSGHFEDTHPVVSMVPNGTNHIVFQRELAGVDPEIVYINDIGGEFPEWSINPATPDYTGFIFVVILFIISFIVIFVLITWLAVRLGKI